jgi:hypothetical protein
MIIAKTEPEALASGAESIIRDGNVWRCYMPGEIQRPEPPPEVPVVSMRAFRRALAQVGLRQAVDDYVAAAPIEVRDDWATAQRVARNDPLIVAAGTALGQDDAAMDGLFAVAQQIEATL